MPIVHTYEEFTEHFEESGDKSNSAYEWSVIMIYPSI